MSFTISRLVGTRALVRGTDVEGTEGSIVVSTEQWDELNQHKALDSATEAFDAAVQEFFAPLTAAAEALGKAGESHEDSLGFVVLQEAVEGQPSQPAHVVRLSHDSKILRLIESGDDSRLVWVGDRLEILEIIPGTHTPTAQQAVANGLGGVVVDDGSDGV